MLLFLAHFACTEPSDGNEVDGAADVHDLFFPWDPDVGPMPGAWSFRFGAAEVNSVFASDPRPDVDEATIRPDGYGDSIGGDEVVDIIALWPNTDGGLSIPVNGDGSFELITPGTSGGGVDHSDWPCLESLGRSTETKIEGKFTSARTVDWRWTFSVRWDAVGTCSAAEVLAYVNATDSMVDYYGSEVVALEGEYAVHAVGAWVEAP